MSNIQCIKSSLISPPFILPDGWKWYKWGDLVVSYEQGLIRSNLDLVDHGTFYFKMHNIDEAGFCNYEKREYTKASDAEIAKYSISNGDFLINVRNSYELVGKTCVVSNIPDKATYNHMIIKVVHVDNRLNYYINALFSKTFWRKYVEACRKGTTTVIALYKDDLLNIPIPIPSEYVFNEIYELEKAFIDKRTKNLLICSELEMMAKTLYDYWFTQFDFPNEEGKPYRSSGGAMEWNEQLKREIPKDWDVVPVTESFDVCYGFPFDTECFVEDPSAQPVVRIRDILEGSISAYTTEKVDKKYWLHSGDMIIGMDGNFHINFWDSKPALLNQRCVRIRSTCEYPVFMAYFSSLPYIKAREKTVSRTTVGHLSADDIKALYVFKPDAATLASVKSIFNAALEKICQVKDENRELTKLRDWLLPMLMNGQATVE